MKPSPVPPVAVVTDSTADIPSELTLALKIEVVPAVITIGGRSFQDGVEISRETFYSQLESFPELPTTGAPSPYAFETTYEKALSGGAKEVFSVHVSSKLSGMYNAAVQGAKSFGERVRVFDSENVSLGLGFQAIEAATIAKAGKPLHDVIQAARNAREGVRVAVMIDTLEYLRRSGRVSWLGAELGNLLNIRLLIEIRQGMIHRLGQARTRAKALQRLSSLVQSWGTLDRLAVGHSSIPELAKEMAEKMVHFSQRSPLVVLTTPAIGVHVGPGAIGVFGLKRKPATASRETNP